MSTTDSSVNWPFGLAVTETLTATGAQAITVNDNLTYIDGVTTEATGNRTLDITLGSDLEVGARIVVASKTNGTETTICGTNITGPTITGVAGKTKCFEAVYTGSGFVVTGTAVQID